MTNQDILRRAIFEYGEQSQTDMMMEEMSELTKAILKRRRCPSDETNENLLEEMADVQIMLDQMYLMYGRPLNYRKEKLLRLAERLGMVTYENGNHEDH